jgi:hypothetical protein
MKFPIATTLTLSEQTHLELIPSVRKRLDRIHQHTVLLEGQIALLAKIAKDGEDFSNVTVGEIAAATQSILDDVRIDVTCTLYNAKGIDKILAPDDDERDLLAKAGVR